MGQIFYNKYCVCIDYHHIKMLTVTAEQIFVLYGLQINQLLC